MQETIKRLSFELGIPKADILNAYKAFWKFIKETIASFPMKEELSEEEFNKLRVNFNIPNLGKLYCEYGRYKSLIESYNNDKHKEDKTNE